VGRRDFERYLQELKSDLDIDRTAINLQKLGWLSSLHLKGVWAFVPVGEETADHPYLDLYGWRARDQNETSFILAGEAAAWHLGYLPRRFGGKTALWLPPNERVPHGLRSYITLIRIDWGNADSKLLIASTKFLHKKRLDLTAWSGGLPAFGPEALTAQLAVRPVSFRSWEDIIPQLDLLIADCDTDRLIDLLKTQSASAWQRAAYIFDRAGKREQALAILARGPRPMSKAELGKGPESHWSNEFQVNDHLIAPLQQKLGKA
jgi:hypothetical protein